MNIKTASTIALWALHQQNPNDLAINTELKERERERFEFHIGADIHGDSDANRYRKLSEESLDQMLLLGTPAREDTFKDDLIESIQDRLSSVNFWEVALKEV